MLRENGVSIGRFRVRRLMHELGLLSRQPGQGVYQYVPVERPDTPEPLKRERTLESPHQVGCGDINYIWAPSRWHYMAVVLDLYARRIIGWAFSTQPDAEWVIKTLDLAYE